jgi:DNA repair photolyase
LAVKIDPGYYASPRWSWEILDCAMPMTFDTYSNCAHQCVYCFAFFQRAIGNSKDAYMYHRVKAVNVEKVKRMFLEPDKYAGQFAPYIKARYVLQWGGLSDGFDWYERHFRTSLELLRFFREIDYPVSISTKGVWFLEDDEYREVLEGATNTHWKYSIITLDPLAMKKLEAGTPTSLERFEAMRQLNELGVGATTLRFRPFVIGTSEHHVDEMFALARDVGCYSVTTEFLCIEKRAGPNHRERYRRISEVVGYDVWEFYRRHSYSGSGLMRLNYDLKRPHIRKMERVAAENGLKFFVSDAHHKEASAGGGCCGLPETGPLSQWNRGQYSEAMQIAKARGEVRFSDIAGEAEWLKEIPWAGAIG